MIKLVFILYALANDSYDIMTEVTSSFQKQCGYISSIEENIIRFLDDKYKAAQDNNVEDVLSCYRNSMTQITSVNYIYKQLCNALSNTNYTKSKANLVRYFVGTRKYRHGIKLQHSILNDCLSLTDDGQKYFVDLDHNRIKAEYLKQRLDEIKPNKDFLPNRVNYR